MIPVCRADYKIQNQRGQNQRDQSSHGNTLLPFSHAPAIDSTHGQAIAIGLPRFVYPDSSTRCRLSHHAGGTPPGGPCRQLLDARKGDPRKVALPTLLKSHTSVGNQWLAERLQIGHKRSLSRLIRHGSGNWKIKAMVKELRRMLPCEGCPLLLGTDSKI